MSTKLRACLGEHGTEVCSPAREVWFQRAMIGGWTPIHRKGYLLLFGGLGIISLLGAAAALIIGLNGPRAVAALFLIAAICVGVAVWVLSLLHSRPWSDRNAP